MNAWPGSFLRKIKMRKIIKKIFGDHPTPQISFDLMIKSNNHYGIFPKFKFGIMRKSLINKFFLGPIIFLAVILDIDNSYAQGPPIFTDTPLLLGLEGGGIRTFGKYISKENANIYMQPFVVPYNLTAKLNIGLIIPYVRKSPDGKETQSGIGDIGVFTKYVILQKDYTRKTFRTLVKVTQRFPTGRTNSDPAIGLDVYQTSIGLVSGFITTKYGIYTEVGYNIVSNNLSDNFIYNVAFGYPLLPQRYPPKQLNAYLEFNGNYVLDNNQNNLFISPGLQFIAGRRVLFETGIQLPLIEDVPDNLKTNFMYTLGTRILIF